MYCYDCSRKEHPTTTTAIGVCAACGVGVCAEHARFGIQTIDRMEGFVSAEVSNVNTRVLNCPQCSDAVHAHHPAEEGLAHR